MLAVTRDGRLIVIETKRKPDDKSVVASLDTLGRFFRRLGRERNVGRFLAETYRKKRTTSSASSLERRVARYGATIPDSIDRAVACVVLGGCSRHDGPSENARGTIAEWRAENAGITLHLIAMGFHDPTGQMVSPARATDELLVRAWRL